MYFNFSFLTLKLDRSLKCAVYKIDKQPTSMSHPQLIKQVIEEN